jgi:hypothetical protein
MNIRWTRLALSDLDEAYNYIAINNPSVANETIERITQRNAFKFYLIFQAILLRNHFTNVLLPILQLEFALIQIGFTYV